MSQLRPFLLLLPSTGLAQLDHDRVGEQPERDQGAEVDQVAQVDHPIQDRGETGDEAERGHQVDQFARILAERYITVSVRKSRGRDIRAACGQLIVEGARTRTPGQTAATLLDASRV